MAQAKNMMKRKELRLTIALWIALFVMTFLVTELSVRGILSAFFAWAGGIVTVELNDHFKESRLQRRFEHVRNTIPGTTHG